LFRNRPSLAAELLRDVLKVELPRYTEARIDSSDLSEVQPVEYRADLVVLLLNGKPVLGIIVEVQLSLDERKRFVWPVYATNLRARLECAVYVLVVTTDEAVARWAAKPVDLGGSSRFVPLVLGPSGIPEVTNEAEACADPELAVLSAMSHGKGADAAKSARIALAAQLASLRLDAERSKLYYDLILFSLSEAARRALRNMDPVTYEYQSDFAKRYVAQGREEGEVKGRATLIIKQLSQRFGPLPEEALKTIAQASIPELDDIGERLLSAGNLSDALTKR